MEVAVLAAVDLVVAVLAAVDFAEVPHRSEWADLGQVDRHLAELVLRE